MQNKQTIQVKVQPKYQEAGSQYWNIDLHQMKAQIGLQYVRIRRLDGQFHVRLDCLEQLVAMGFEEKVAPRLVSPGSALIPSTTLTAPLTCAA